MGVSPWRNCGSVHSTSYSKASIHYRQYLYISPIPPTSAVDPLLTIPSFHLLCISDEGVLREEGGGGEDEGTRAIWRLRSREADS